MSSPPSTRRSRSWRAGMAEALRRTFASARSSRNFRLFLSGQFVSAIGTWMNFTASGWLVWRLTHSGAALGVNSALAFGPMLILGAWGGVLADRFNKRKILITTQSAYALLAVGSFRVENLWLPVDDAIRFQHHSQIPVDDSSDWVAAIVSALLPAGLG